MSHTENIERENGSGRTNDVANERDKSDARVSTESPIDGERNQIELKTSQILNGASNSETDGNSEIRADTKLRDDDLCVSSGDICRICHMGRCASTADNNHSSRDSSQDRVDRTSASSHITYLGPLISACKCRGTVALVHVECLERWLTESGRVRCELCGYKYATKRVRRYNLFRSVVVWFHTVIATRQVAREISLRRNRSARISFRLIGLLIIVNGLTLKYVLLREEMLLDIGYLVMTTPVAAFSCYVCTLALRMLLRNSFYEIPWMIVAMLPTCLLTLIAYWRWIITLGRLHGHRWRRYWRNNFVIRLIPDNGGDNTEPNEATDRRSSDDGLDAQEDFEQWRFEEIEELT